MTTATKTAPAPVAVGLRTAAQMYGVSTETVARAVRTGALHAKRTGVDEAGNPAGRYLIRVTDLETWFDGLEDA